MKPLVLIAEDEPVIAMVLRETMTEQGYAAETVSDGVTALHRLREEPLPALILLDLFLPGLSGRELLAAMRGGERLREVPVVLVTGAVPDSRDFPPAGTYQEVIGKPFHLASVVAAVERLIGPPT